MASLTLRQASAVDPNVDMKGGIRDQVDAMDIRAYFSYLVQLMKTNPPSADDAPLWQGWQRSGWSWNPPAITQVQ
jgi:hypothetical protein